MNFGKVAAIHGSVLVLLLALFTMRAFMAPIYKHSLDFYMWLVPVFAIYLALFHLILAFKKAPGRHDKEQK